jgi:lipopolysaccharide export LptBFGC system permease protein LptF
MVLTLENGEMHELDDSGSYRRLEFRRHVINIPMDDDLVRRDRQYRSDEETVMPALLAHIRRLGAEAAELARQQGSLGANPNEVEKMRRDELASKLKHKRMEARRYEVELQKRLSLAFSAFFFALFGVPVGLLLRRGGIGTGFIVGLVFFALFYVLLLAGQNLAESGRLPPWVGMWLPNLVLVLPVIELTSRAFFERPLLSRPWA